ncbi:Ig-like domain-containing protein [Shivajiella indica]|uniref:Ig-like domain-containing protein n=2 Tax=Shivajiella indica TaxID=872115 RepID=A0ABW5BEB4_9BACT
MGGPRDEDAPQLLSITPEIGSLNTKPSTIEIEFNEYVKVENPNKQIIITPRIKKDEMEVATNRNKVIIKLNQELEDSTTYVFNFQKTIKDITEGNPPENLKLVFSTGPEIDSLTFSGNVSYLFQQRDTKLKDILVGLYELSDTTNVLTAPPYYIAQADSIGDFIIENIKSGEYLAYAWHDANNSLKAEEKQEDYSFILDTIRIDKDISGAKFYLTKADLSDFKINRTSNIGNHFDLVLSKYPVEIKIENESLNKELFYSQSDKNIRLYHTSLRNDSTEVKITLTDSVGFKIDTTLYAKFLESERKKDPLEVQTGGKKNFVDKLVAEFKYNKPLQKINYDSLIIKYDTASVIQVQKDWVFFPDSLDRTKLFIVWSVPDSITYESFTLSAADSTFYDIENQTNEKKIENTFRKLKQETLAEEIKVKVNTPELPIIVQIQDKKDEIIAEQYLTETNEAVFKNIDPGIYYIRAIIDRNKNRKWDTSNMLENRYPEPVYYLENPNDNNNRDTTIRGGWVLELNIEPRRSPGLPINEMENIPKKEKNNVDK